MIPAFAQAADDRCDLGEVVRVAGRVGFAFEHPFAVFWPGPPVTAELGDDHHLGAGHVTVPGEHFGQFSSPIPFLNPVAIVVVDLNFDTTADCWNRRNGHVPKDTRKGRRAVTRSLLG